MSTPEEILAFWFEQPAADAETTSEEMAFLQAAKEGGNA
jgi:hypothetical protein